MMRLRWAHSEYAVVLQYEPDDKTWRSAVVPRRFLPEITEFYVDQNRDHVFAMATRKIMSIADEQQGK